MANVDNANGLSPVRYISGAPYNGATNMYAVPASDSAATYIGQMVRLAGDAATHAPSGAIVPTVAAATTGQPVIGVVVSIADPVVDSLLYRAASTLRYVNVADDPNLLFEVQCNGTLTTTMIGNVADASTMSTGTAGTGRSLTELNIATVSASGDGTEDFLIVGFSRRVDNEMGADAKVLVRLNNHALVDGTAGQ